MNQETQAVLGILDMQMRRLADLVKKQLDSAHNFDKNQLLTVRGLCAR